MQFTDATLRQRNLQTRPFASASPAPSFKGRSYGFQDLKTLLAKASPLRSADQMAGIASASELERGVAQWILADLPLSRFIEKPVLLWAISRHRDPRMTIQNIDVDAAIGKVKALIATEKDLSVSLPLQ